jgi:hypothetical protein
MNRNPGVHWYLPGGLSCGQSEFRNGNGAVVGSPGENRRRCGLSHGDALRLCGSIGEDGKGRSVGGFDTCNARIYARLSDERQLARELTEERHEDVACRRRHCGIRRSSWFHPFVERVRLKPAVNGIQSIVDARCIIA